MILRVVYSQITVKLRDEDGGYCSRHIQIRMSRSRVSGNALLRVKIKWELSRSPVKSGERSLYVPVHGCSTLRGLELQSNSQPRTDTRAPEKASPLATTYICNQPRLSEPKTTLGASFDIRPVDPYIVEPSTPTVQEQKTYQLISNTSQVIYPLSFTVSV